MGLPKSNLNDEHIFNKNLILLKKKAPDVVQKLNNGRLGSVDHMESVRDGKGIKNLICRRNDGSAIPIDMFYECSPELTISNYDNAELEDYDILFFIGLGLGYNCRETLKKLKNRPRIVIIEPFLDIFKLAIRMVDFTEIFSYQRLDFYVDSIIPVESVVEAYKNHIPIGKVRIVTLPSYRLLFKKNCTRIEDSLQNNIRATRDNWHTTKNNGRRILSNTIENLSSLFAGSGLNSINGHFKATPAFCIAAGPSLDAALNSLKLIQNNAVIIACDSAINALLNAGIFPNIVVTTDIFEANFDKIKSHVDRLQDSLLVYGIESNPDNVKKFLGHKKVAVSSGSKILLDWLGPRFNLNCKLPPLTSVSQMSIFLAQMLGAEPIILVGMDLSYPKESSHAAGSVMQLDLDSEKLISIPGINGNCVFSSPQLVADKIFMESVITNSNTRFINTSMDGALIQGTIFKSPEEIIADELNRNVNIDGILTKIDLMPSICEAEALKALNEMLVNANRFKARCELNDQKLTDVIDKIDVQMEADSISQKYTGFKQDFDEFQHDHLFLFEILELAIGEEIHDIIKKREKIVANDYIDEKLRIFNEIELIRDNYLAYGKAADFFIRRLNKVSTDLEKSLAWKNGDIDGSIRNKWDNFRKLGNHYAKIGEVWQAEREYLSALEIMPEDPSPWVGMVKMFADSELWRPARDIVGRACSLFPNNTELISLKADIEEKIREIMSQIKDAWVTGDKETTRRLLNGYLLLCPDNEQASLLRKVLKEVDETLAAGSPIAQQQKSSQLPFDEMVANASRYIEKLEFEPAIGIMEGLIQNYPQKKAAFREKIGDIRMLQNDYPSAIWNYRQALDMAPQAAGLCAKIENAQRLEISP